VFGFTDEVGMTEDAGTIACPSWREADRLAALRRFDILDTEPEAAFDDLAALAGQICRAPVALVSFVDEQRQWFKSAAGLSLRETPLAVSICAQAILQPGLFVVPDTSQDRRFSANPLVADEPHLRFYAGALIQTPEGLPLGTVCVLDYEARPDGLTPEQSYALPALARAVMSQLELRRKNRALAESLEHNRQQSVLFDAALGKIKQGLCFFHGDQRLIVCNDRYAAMYSLTPELRRPGTTLRQIVAHRYRVGTCPAMAEAEYLVWRDDTALRSTAADTVVTLRDGRTIAIHHEPMPDGGWVATHDDISAQVEAHERLRVSEERHRALVQASAAVVWQADAAGRNTASERWGEVSGQHGGERAEGWLQVVHPDDRERVAQAWQESVALGRLHAIEHRFWSQELGYRWVLARGVPLKHEDGSVREWVGTLTDIEERKQAEAALRSSEERLRLALECTGLGTWDIDLRTGARQWSPEMRAIMGISADTPADGDTFLNCVHPGDRARIATELGRAASRAGGDASYTSCFRIMRRDNGDERWVEVKGRLFRDGDGQPVRRLGIFQDITERKRAEQALGENEERLRLALHAGRMVAWAKDLSTGHITRSKNSLAVLGIGSGTFSEFLGHVLPEDRSRVEGLHAQEDGKPSQTAEFRYVHPSGAVMWLGVRAEQLGPNCLNGVTFDITERKTAEEEVWRVANHDALTGLPNRALFQKRFEEALAQAERSGTSVSLLVLDLDDFKDVNDTLGHDPGDALLKEIADRLRSMTRDCDTVARIGGDEFAILVVEPLTLEHAARWAEHLTESLRQPFTHQGRLLACRASIGIAAFPDHDRTILDLMKDADLALYRAKAQGKNRVAVYAPDMRAAMEQKARVSNEVREALAANQIVPFYQPKLCLRSGRVVGFEALARWQHPEKGVLTPGYFGVAFQDPEIAELIGAAMIRQVTRDIRRWLAAGQDCGRVAVNLSSAEFGRPDLAETVLDALKALHIPPENFEVEVTETVFLGASSHLVAETLKRFRAAGISIALDDFGTGFASLTHLKQFPVDHIKIDQTFVRGLGSGIEDEAIVSAVVGLGRSLGKHVTAEGVETEEQAARLREIGCDFGQGYLYAKPMAGSRVPWFLSSHLRGAGGRAQAVGTGAKHGRRARPNLSVLR
jgi:diguanylate cyclase (GGDEF)-like protein/PAS domain S-box-containing protein